MSAATGVNDPEPKQSKGFVWLAGIALVLGTYFLFAPTTEFDFIDYDDIDYVVANPHVNGGWDPGEVVWVWTHSHASNWHPLTWMSHMLDVELFGLEAAGHHRVNVLLHALNAVLLFALLLRATGQRTAALLVAAFFALHPLRVESVAWIAERKDLLSGFFWFVTLYAYQRYSERPDLRRMLQVVLAFALGLASKPMVVTLPLVLMLWDVWPGRRTPLDVRLCKLREKLPLFLLALVLALATLTVQTTSGATNRFEDISIVERVVNGMAAYGAYLYQSFVPTHLAVFYPHAVATSDAPFAALALPAALSFLTYGLWFAIGWKLREKAPAVLIGFAWMVITALPIIGIIQVGSQAHADRYTYLPTIGIGIALVYGAAYWLESHIPLRKPIGIAAGVALLPLGYLTLRQIEHWRDTDALFEHALEVTENNYTAHAVLGQQHQARNDNAAAKKHFQAALRIHPNFGEALSNLGLCHLAEGNYPRARALFERALVVRPNDHLALLNRGVLELLEGDNAAAEEDFQRVLTLSPREPDALFNLGYLEQARNDFDMAEVYYLKTLEQLPDHGDALNNLGELRLRMRSYPEAIEMFLRLSHLEPDDPAVHFNLGKAYQAAGQLEAARRAFEEALSRDPQFAPARQALEQM